MSQPIDTVQARRSADSIAASAPKERPLHGLQSRLKVYLVCFTGVAVSILIRSQLTDVIGNAFPFATLYFTVVFAAWYGGAAPALATVVSGGLACVYLFIPPEHSFRVFNATGWVGIVLFLCNSLWVTLLSDQLRRARDRAERSRAEAVRRQDESAQLQRLSKQVEERHRILVEAVRDYAIIMLDSIGRVVSWNSGAQRLFGY